jgi:arabinogalactan endo-1,4-beta-galactosidase
MNRREGTLRARVVRGVLFEARMVNATDYARGADLSFLRQAEQEGVAFKENGRAKPGLQIFKDHGYNWIRLRLFHTPTELPNDLPYTIAAAQDAKKLGFKFLLDFHYSDTWADPEKQFLPRAWEGKSHAELVEAVYAYTRDTMAAFAGRCFSRYGADRQRSHRRNALARWQTARQLEQFRPTCSRQAFAAWMRDAGRVASSHHDHIDKGAEQAPTKWFFDTLPFLRGGIRCDRSILLFVVARFARRCARNMNYMENGL